MARTKIHYFRTGTRSLEKNNQTGRPVLVTRSGEPVALIPPPQVPEKPKTWLGIHEERGRIIGDFNPTLQKLEGFRVKASRVKL